MPTWNIVEGSKKKQKSIQNSKSKNMAIPSANDSVSSRNSRIKNVPEDVVISFKNKASFMKSWTPASSPSVRAKFRCLIVVCVFFFKFK
jgi:hypothetical protein